MLIRCVWVFCALAFSMLFFSGCNSASAPPQGNTGEAAHEHAHPEQGPHQGELMELGNEEYHAELVHDEAAGTVTIYILDGAAKNAVPIEAHELTINLKLDGQGSQFKLPAAPDAGDPAGQSSRFSSSEKTLAEGLDAMGADPELVVDINGKQFRGKLEHDHNH